MYYSNGEYLAVSQRDVDFLKTAASASTKRARLCFHSSPKDTQQEMLIVMHRDSYVCPHRHHQKVETLSLVEGSCHALLFDIEGNLIEQVAMSTPCKGGAFFYRMPPGLFHSLVFLTEWVVFVETTMGPFTKHSNELALWAPPETEPLAGVNFLLSTSGLS